MDNFGAGALLTRRNMMLGLGLGGAGAAAAAAAGLGFSWSAASSKNGASWWDSTFVSLRNGNTADWVRIAGESFTLQGESGPSLWKVMLVRNVPSPGRRPANVGRKQAFAVTLQSVVKKAPEGNRIYTIDHPKYDPLPIFVGAPVPYMAATRLIALFN